MYPVCFEICDSTLLLNTQVTAIRLSDFIKLYGLVVMEEVGLIYYL